MLHSKEVVGLNTAPRRTTDFSINAQQGEYARECPKRLSMYSKLKPKSIVGVHCTLDANEVFAV